jgi:predicted transcriptional regulator
MITKQNVLETIKDMPEQFSVDELLDRLILIQKIEIGSKQFEAGEFYTHEEAKEKLKKWLK